MMGRKRGTKLEGEKKKQKTFFHLSMRRGTTVTVIVFIWKI